MKKVAYTVRHLYQPTNSTCSQTALSILLSYYGLNFTPQEIEKKVPQVKDANGKNNGTINQQLATWALSLNFRVDLFTFDCQIIDQGWAKLSKAKLLERLEARKNGWVVPSLGETWSEAYAQAYIDFIKAGGELHIHPSVSSKWLYRELKSGPVLPLVCFNTLYGTSRTRHDGAIKSIFDDVNGKAFNHSVVIYGNDEKGNFLIADPWQKPGLHTIEPERMIAAISTAQIECDNLFFVLRKKNNTSK